MRVFYFVRKIDMVPSCIYNILMLRSLGYNVFVCCETTTDSINRVLDTEGVEYRFVSLKMNSITKLESLRIDRKYRKTTNELLNEKAEDGDVAFLGTGDTVLCLRKEMRRIKTVVCIKELYDQQPFYRRLLSYYCKKATTIVACEKNRARVMYFSWKLRRIPEVLSNKPFLPAISFSKNETTLPEKVSSIVDRIIGHKVILYQGYYIGYPVELENIAHALARMNSDYLFVLVGIIKESHKKKIESIYPNVITVGHIKAPFHMEITRHASIGITVYDETSLNNLFCAPNKIYEYAMFGIPSLCNDLPGLVETIGVNRAGLCVDIYSIDGIEKAIKEIDENYEYYSSAAKQFYQSEDNLSKIDLIVKKTIAQQDDIK